MVKSWSSSCVNAMKRGHKVPGWSRKTGEKMASKV
jgi:hypothetical protein